MKFSGLFSGFLLLACSTILPFSHAFGDEIEERNRILVIIVDGLRPDYVTSEIMPHVHALGERGVVGLRSTAVFPSFTRPNRVSIATGAYPGTHGVVHNSLHHPDLDEPVHTSRQEQMRELEEISGSPMITTKSLGEMLSEHGQRLLALGNSAWLLNHHAKGKGYWESGGNFSSEKAGEEVVAAIGRPPRGGRGPDRTAWEVDSYLHDSLGDDPAEVVLLWMGEPDAAGHSHGVGAPETLEAVASVDQQIGRLLEAHEERGLTDRVNIFITSDHGFTQSTGTLNYGHLMNQADLGDHVTRLSSMIWINSGEEAHFRRMVEVLHRDDRVGNVYARPRLENGTEGLLPGTLSTGLIRWNHERSSDILFTPAWSHEENEHGWRGVTSRRGTATHGSDSPYDMHIPLIAAGPDLKTALRSSVPTGNVDFVPTILAIRGIDIPAEVEGRVWRELLVGGPSPDEVEHKEEIFRSLVKYDDGFTYEAALETSIVDGTIYLHGAYSRRSSVGEER